MIRRDESTSGQDPLGRSSYPLRAGKERQHACRVSISLFVSRHFHRLTNLWSLFSIVLVHGFGGHPMRSWQSDDRIAPNPRAKAIPPARDKPVKNLLKKTRSSDKTERSTAGGAATQKNLWHFGLNAPSRVYWPRDLLPVTCPEARIITWGYHTLHSGNMPVAAQPDLFAHVNDLLQQLGDLRHGGGVQQRPLIFIAHSLGGVIVKEVGLHIQHCMQKY